MAAGTPAQQSQRARAFAGAGRSAAPRLRAQRRSGHQEGPGRRDRPGEPARGTGIGARTDRARHRPRRWPAAVRAAHQRAGAQHPHAGPVQGRRGGRRQSRRPARRLHAAPARRTQLAVAEGGGEGARAGDAACALRRFPRRAGRRQLAAAGLGEPLRPAHDPGGQADRRVLRRAAAEPRRRSVLRHRLGHHRPRDHRRPAGQHAQRRAARGARPARHSRHPLGLPSRLPGAGRPRALRRAHLARLVAAPVAAGGRDRVRRPRRLPGGSRRARGRIPAPLPAAHGAGDRPAQPLAAGVGGGDAAGALVAPAHKEGRQHPSPRPVEQQ